MTHNPVPSHTPPAHQRTLEICLDDFVQCKTFLAQHFQLQPDQQSLLARMPPAQLYTVGETLGISSGQMAQAIAAFLHLPYLDQLAPEDVRSGVLSMSFCQARGVLPLQRASTPHTGRAHPAALLAAAH